MGETSVHMADCWAVPMTNLTVAMVAAGAVVTTKSMGHPRVWMGRGDMLHYGVLGHGRDQRAHGRDVSRDGRLDRGNCGDGRRGEVVWMFQGGKLGSQSPKAWIQSGTQTLTQTLTEPVIAVVRLGGDVLGSSYVLCHAAMGASDRSCAWSGCTGVVVASTPCCCSGCAGPNRLR